MTIANEIPKDWRPSKGAHGSYGEGSCALEMADYVARKRAGKRITKRTKLTDRPACVRPTIGAFLRSWNDSLDDDDRARLITPDLILITLDTSTTAADNETCAWMALDWFVRVYTPAWLDAAQLGEHAAALRALAPIETLEALK